MEKANYKRKEPRKSKCGKKGGQENHLLHALAGTFFAGVRSSLSVSAS